jgi:hypothetical protein
MNTVAYNMDDLRERLRSRFHAVIISRGYSEAAAQGILKEWLPKYMQDVEGFKKMLEEYETGKR